MTSAKRAVQTRQDHAPRAQASYPQGPRPVGALLPAVTRAAFRRRGPAAAQVLADWDMIAGAALAAVTAPRKLQAGTLTIACPGPVALELQHLAPQLIGRINRHLGHETVARLRFERETPSAAPAEAPPPAPTAADASLAEAAVAGLPPGGLREALARLGAAVIAARGRPPGPR